MYNPYVEFIHYESQTRGIEDTDEKYQRFVNEVEIFQKEWKEELKKGDPYYNKNLKLVVRKGL